MCLIEIFPGLHRLVTRLSPSVLSSSSCTLYSQRPKKISVCKSFLRFRGVRIIFDKQGIRKKQSTKDTDTLASVVNNVNKVSDDNQRNMGISVNLIHTVSNIVV